MDHLLSRLERRFGKFAVANLTTVLVAGTVLVFLLSVVRPQFINLIDLDLGRVAQGQVWRLFTYVFIPTYLPDLKSPMSMILWCYSIYWIYLTGSSLESEWGAFKLNMFLLTGMLGTTIAAAVSGGAVGSGLLVLTLFLAFATVFPDYQILLFFVLPIKMKWLGILSGGFLVYSAVTGSWEMRAAVVAGSANYLLFFGEHLWGLWKGRNLAVRQAANRASSRPPPAVAAGRSCAICGEREEDGADIRVCSCEKCGGQQRTLCLAHARNH